MANKFQKSVLERLEQEATRQKQKSKIKKPEQPPAEKPAVHVAEIEAEQPILAIEQAPVITQAAVPEVFAPEVQPQKQESQALPDIGEYLRRDNQRLAKNKTFYLDNDVIEAIKSTSKVQHVTDSKLVNDILRHVLGLQ